MKTYEIKTYGADPFDVACGDCEQHEIEFWAEVSEDELKEIHREQLDADEYTAEAEKDEYEAMFGVPWTVTPADFQEYVAAEIKSGNLREK